MAHLAAILVAGAILAVSRAATAITAMQDPQEQGGYTH